MQLKKQVNNKIRKILKNSKWIQIPNLNPLCGVGEKGFSPPQLSCHAKRCEASPNIRKGQKTPS
jgi:hypothetical protein